MVRVVPVEELPQDRDWEKDCIVEMLGGDPAWVAVAEEEPAGEVESEQELPVASFVKETVFVQKLKTCTIDGKVYVSLDRFMDHLGAINLWTEANEYRGYVELKDSEASLKRGRKFGTAIRSKRN